MSIKDQLNEELRDNAALQDFTDINALAKSYVDTKSAVGNSIRIPNKEAGEEEQAAFREKLKSHVPSLVDLPSGEDDPGMAEFLGKIGVPTSADGYQIPEGVTLDGETEQLIRENAYFHGMSQAQFNKNIQKVLEGQEKQKDTLSTNIEGLKEKWGQAYEQNLNRLVSNMEQAKAPADMIAAIKAGKMGPEAVNYIYELMSSASESEPRLGDDPDATSRTAKLTPAQAEEEIDAIFNNHEHPYHNPEMEGHQRAAKRMIELFRMKGPKKGSIIDATH